MAKTRGWIGAAAAVGALTGGLTWYVTADAEQTAIADLPPVWSAGADRLPSVTAQDWVTYADHVALVEVTRDVPYRLEPGAEQTGEGMRLRKVTFTVEELLWSSSEAAEPLPESFSFLSHGWVHKGQAPEQSRLMTPENAPRLERGHAYVFAFDADACPEEADLPWRGLGQYGSAPADGEVVGDGEFEGRTVNGFAFGDDPAESFRRAMAGRSVAEVAEALTRARPIPPGQRPEFPTGC